MKTEKYQVTGMTCAACQANVTRCVQKLPGVEDVNVSLLANQMTVSYDENQVNPETIVQAVEHIGYGTFPPLSACAACRRKARTDSVPFFTIFLQRSFSWCPSP